ncbi:MAG: response regulator [Thermodesulfobacteriota bacterium]|jgi:CheY-like chemotaxis protein
MNVLIIDDMEDIRRVIRTTLERRLGCHAFEAANVGEALDAMHRAGPFDLLITDIHMPGLSGGSLIRRLRAHDETRETPILVVSVDASNHETVQYLLRQGATAFLGKPFTMDVLTEKVDDVLRETRSRSKDDATPHRHPPGKTVRAVEDALFQRRFSQPRLSGLRQPCGRPFSTPWRHS